MSRSLPRPPARVIHYLVFGFVAGVAAVSAAASGRYWLLRWLPLVPHESRASSVDRWKHQTPVNDDAKPVPSNTPPETSPALTH